MTKPRETETVTIWTSKKFKQKLRKLARDLDISMSAYARMAINAFEKMNGGK